MSVQSTQSCPKSTDHSNGSQVSSSTTSSVSEVTQSHSPPDEATNPPVSEQNHSDSDTVDTEMTDNTRSTSQSKPSSDRMSTTTARFREIDKLLNNQKQLAAKHEQMSSDRISQIERQLHRITGPIYSCFLNWSALLSYIRNQLSSKETNSLHERTRKETQPQ